MEHIDPADLKPKKPKIGVSLSLDAENLDYLKRDIEKYAPEGVTLSQFFDGILENVVRSLKNQRELNTKEKEKSQKEGDGRES